MSRHEYSVVHIYITPANNTHTIVKPNKNEGDGLFFKQ